MIDLGLATTLAELVEAARAAEEGLKNQRIWYRGSARRGWTPVPRAHRRHPVIESQVGDRSRVTLVERVGRALRSRPTVVSPVKEHPGAFSPPSGLRWDQRQTQ